jgi:hypothetical protein
MNHPDFVSRSEVKLSDWTTDIFDLFTMMGLVVLLGLALAWLGGGR